MFRFSLKQIIILTLALILCFINFWYGSAISTFLTVSIVASIIYFLGWLFAEKHLATLRPDLSGLIRDLYIAKAKERATTIMSIITLLVIYFCALITIKRVLLPGESNGWFNNTDHYALAHSATLFKNTTTLQTTSVNQTQQGSVTVRASSNGATIQANTIPLPIFAKYSDGRFYLANPIFTKGYTQNFVLRNANTTISVTPQANGKNTIYKVELICTNTALLKELNEAEPYTAQFSINHATINKGIRLYDLLINGKDVHTNNSAYTVLEKVLQPISETLILKGSDGKWYLHPDANCLALGYSLVADGSNSATNMQAAAQLNFNQAFYIGFGNHSQQLSVEKRNGNYALVYDYPPHYSLSAAQKVPMNTRQSSFVVNGQDAMINNTQNSGFYFHNYNMPNVAVCNANINYYHGSSRVASVVEVRDVIGGKSTQLNSDEPVLLQTSDPDVQHEISLRDWSQHKFSYNHILKYLSILLGAIILLLCLAPGEGLQRIETIIWVCIFSLFTVRYIISWRLATFPPTEDISKFELENTIRNFDNKLFGLNLPLPSSLLFALLIIALLGMYRIFKRKKIIDAFANKIDAYSSKQLLLGHGIFLVILLCIHFFIKEEVIRRIVDILLPLLAHLFFAYWANVKFQYTEVTTEQAHPNWRNQLRALFYYITAHPVFVITLSTFAYFAIVDRGFAVLFLLFVLLKNILVNFLKASYKPDKQTLRQMFTRVSNYWPYAIVAFIVYILILGVKPLFYYLITYKLVVLCSILALTTLAIWVIHPLKKKLHLAALSFTVLCTILTIIPATRRSIDSIITEKIKHVQFRANIITQPISAMLEQNEYSGFNTKKIIETAENQWFINTYISKHFDHAQPINLRAFTKIGVNYSTQTRDVVLARFVIGEMGELTMILLLIITALPMLLYLVSYKIKVSDENASNPIHLGTYGALLPLLLIFTIALFVWLTSTNRFVFFGQDFPFLSIASRVSVLLPMLLFAASLVHKPQPYYSEGLQLGKGLARYLFLIGVALAAVFITRPNHLDSINFSATVPSAEHFINHSFNNALRSTQEELITQKRTYNYNTLMKAFFASERYKMLQQEASQSVYLTSILKQLQATPSIATRINSPLHIVYDRGYYEAMYNKTVYLQLAPTDEKERWRGKIYEHLSGTSESVTLEVNGNALNISAPSVYQNPQSRVKLALVPSSWLAESSDACAIVSIDPALRKTTSLFLVQGNTPIVTSSSFATTISTGNGANLKSGTTNTTINLINNQRIFAINKWINGTYRTLYPLRDDNFWMYHFANAVKSAYSSDSLLLNNVQLNFDYQLHKDVHGALESTYNNLAAENSKFRFSVIAATGDGALILMDDIVKNRKPLDPNDPYKIYLLSQKHFFYSNTQNERDQWGSSNLTTMYLGPGSSVKPVFTAATASMVNAGWQNLKLNATMGAEVNNYAGLKLAIPWRNVDGESGIYDMPRYIEKSSNYYHSTIMFLGAYPKQAFLDSSGHASLNSILSNTAGANNTTPVLEFNGQRKYLPNYRTKAAWPVSDIGINSFFGNNNSVMANGLEVNANLATKVKVRNRAERAIERANFTDSVFYARLAAQKSSSFMWSFPEPSSFLQNDREFTRARKKQEIQENFLFGLQTPTLGGTPHKLTAHKLVEMYASMFTQNRDYRAHIIPQRLPYTPWFTDSTWTYDEYKNFLATNIFTGMKRAVQSGTAIQLHGCVPNQYYIYAKTGTINDGDARSSRRLVVCITDKDVCNPANIGPNTKVLTLYFMIDGTGDFNWALVRDIIAKCINSRSCNSYFSNQ